MGKIKFRIGKIELRVDSKDRLRATTVDKAGYLKKKTVTGKKHSEQFASITMGQFPANGRVESVQLGISGQQTGRELQEAEGE